ncbi:hypothetical protein BD779DRAFT_778337 [Infundibulicybe gibba]|nr:hypothetical protein BD779DRAFT_778337 [Infundibulicybe gibba]
MESRSHHHTMDQPPPSRVSSSENPPNAVPTPSSTSTLGPIPSLQPSPAALAAIFQSSFWIWQGTEALTGVPSGDWAFRKTLPISTAPAREAIALLTVDDGFQLYHNGQFIGENSTLGWQMATAVRVNLDPGPNVFAIRAHNSPSRGNPNGNSSAGLLASIQILYTDGTTTTISSDDTWYVAQPLPDGFQLPSFDDTAWPSATTLVKHGSGPWGYIALPPQVSYLPAR